MFIHIFRYRFIALLRNRQTIFWTLAFPLILATLFKMAFGNLEKADHFDPIPVAVVDNEDYRADTGFQETLNSVSSGKDRLFDLSVLSADQAEDKLKDGSLSGFFSISEGKIELNLLKSGISQSILRVFLDHYQQTSSTIGQIVKTNPEQLPAVLEELKAPFSFYREVPVSKAAPNLMNTYFYALIAMACLYGGFFGNMEVINVQANLSSIAARFNMAPVHKMKSFLYSCTASLAILFLELLLLLGYIQFLLQVDLGNKPLHLLLTILASSMLGIVFGAFISSMTRKGLGIKIALLIGISMIGSFLSGMMYHDMKYLIAQKAPVLSWINPSNLVTDALYSLYYFDTYRRYWLNMAAIGIFIALFSLITYLKLRRQKYASL